MRVIYEPKGRAREYSTLALNLYNGCNHGCLYCYSPDCLRVNRHEFYRVQKARDILNKIEADCRELYGSKERVLLCFTCDPYQKINDNINLTRKTLELFKLYNIPFQVLTKAGNRAQADFELYRPGDAFATTLTFLDEGKSRYYEPQAALPKDRIETIKKAHSMGIETWVSFEPVLNDGEVFKLLDSTYEFVDLYKVGKVSNFETDKPINWTNFVKEVIRRLKSYGKPYYIKKDLAKYLN